MPRTSPIRTCIGCGERTSPSALVRLCVRSGTVEVDAAHAGGRGAWMHAAEACLDRAIRRRAFGRAFRASGVQVEARVLRDLLTGSGRKD